MNWFELAIVAIVFLGVADFLIKIAYDFLDWKWVFIFTDVGILIVTLSFYLYLRPTFAGVTHTGFFITVIAGIITSLGAVAFYLALSQSKVSIITPLIALYPVVTITLAILFLKERLTLYQGIGIVLALISIFLISLGE